MHSPSWDPYGALQAHSLAAHLPLVRCRLPHLLLFWALQFQVRLKQGTFAGSSPSGVNTQSSARDRETKHILMNN